MHSRGGSYCTCEGRCDDDCYCKKHPSLSEGDWCGIKCDCNCDGEKPRRHVGHCEYRDCRECDSKCTKEQDLEMEWQKEMDIKEKQKEKERKLNKIEKRRIFDMREKECIKNFKMLGWDHPFGPF